MSEGGIYGYKHAVNLSLEFHPKKSSCEVLSKGAVLGVFSVEALEPLQLQDEDFCNRLAILKKVTIFRYLSEDQTQNLVKAFRELDALQNGDSVFQEGSLGDEFYITKDGEVRAELASGKVLRTVGKNDYFGERALMYDEPRSASIICISNDMSLWSMKKKSFLEILQYRIQLQNTFLTMDDLAVQKTVG